MILSGFCALQLSRVGDFKASNVSAGISSVSVVVCEGYLTKRATKARLKTVSHDLTSYP